MSACFKSKRVEFVSCLALLAIASYACSPKEATQSNSTSAKNGASDSTVAAPVEFDSVLLGVPSVTVGTLDIKVTGLNVVEYRYSLMDGDVTCESATYGLFVPSSAKIADTISSADGIKTLCVQGKLSSGAIQKTPNRFTFIKRSNEPIVDVDNPPTGVNSLLAVNVIVRSINALSYSYAVIKGEDCATANFVSFKEIIASEIKENLDVDGVYSLCLKGKAGDLMQATPTKYTWTKDTIAETPEIGGAPLGQSSVLKLNVTINQAFKYQYKIADAANCNDIVYGDFVDGKTPITDDIGVDGVKTLCVRAKDEIGNISKEAASVTWIKDSILPLAEVASLPANGTKSNKININAKVSGNITEYKYSVSAGVACDTAGLAGAVFIRLADEPNISIDISSRTLFPDGMVTVCVLGANAAGSVQGLPNIYTWEKDTVPPANAVLTGVPATLNNLSTVNIKVNGTYAGYKYVFKTSPDLSPVLSCPAENASDESFIVRDIVDDLNAATAETAEEIASRTITMTAMSTDGQKRLCVYSRDVAGNYQKVATMAAWLRDSVLVRFAGTCILPAGCSPTNYSNTKYPFMIPYLPGVNAFDSIVFNSNKQLNFVIKSNYADFAAEADPTLNDFIGYKYAIKKLSQQELDDMENLAVPRTPLKYDDCRIKSFFIDKTLSYSASVLPMIPTGISPIVPEGTALPILSQSSIKVDIPAAENNPDDVYILGVKFIDKAGNENLIYRSWHQDNVGVAGSALVDITASAPVGFKATTLLDDAALANPVDAAVIAASPINVGGVYFFNVSGNDIYGYRAKFSQGTKPSCYPAPGKYDEVVSGWGGYRSNSVGVALGSIAAPLAAGNKLLCVIGYDKAGNPSATFHMKALLWRQ